MSGHPMSADRWAAVRRVLAVRLDSVGDVLMTTPALAALKAVPGTHLTLLTSPACAPLHGLLPDVDALIAWRAPWVKPGAADPAYALFDERTLVQRLAGAGFDACVIFTVSTQSALPAALLCRMAGIGLRLAHSRENPYGLLSDWVPERDLGFAGMRHEVRRQLDLVASAGFAVPQAPRLRLCWRDVEAQAMRQKLRTAGGSPDVPYAVVHPGATAASRRYPPERFGAAAALLARASGCQVVFASGKEDVAAAQQARAAMEDVPSVSLAGALSLGELSALIAKARVLVCNNSAPAHIAAATGTPVAVLYAQTNPQHRPWGVPARVLFEPVPCANCLQSVCPRADHACLLGVTPQQVCEAALSLMEEGDARGVHAGIESGRFAAAAPCPAC